MPKPRGTYLMGKLRVFRINDMRDARGAEAVWAECACKVCTEVDTGYRRLALDGVGYSGILSIPG
jgi:hypothetical protein